jgi:HAD superfamily hydrolase (TIGR01509 family)
MSWLQNYKLYLFDFDGLLVDTEEMHYAAFKRTLLQKGIDLKWDFARYCQIAHYEADAIIGRLYADYPRLVELQPSKTALYAEKTEAMLQLINEQKIKLMPGVEKFLIKLENAKLTTCVVTHSSDDIVKLIRKQNPVLEKISHWITREHYNRPKPYPDSYITAIQKYSKPGDGVIGFEDTPRGVSALLPTKATIVLVTKDPYPEIPSFLSKGVYHYASFEDLPDDKL